MQKDRKGASGLAQAYKSRQGCNRRCDTERIQNHSVWCTAIISSQIMRSSLISLQERAFSTQLCRGKTRRKPTKISLKIRYVAYCDAIRTTVVGSVQMGGKKKGLRENYLALFVTTPHMAPKRPTIDICVCIVETILITKGQQRRDRFVYKLSISRTDSPDS